MSDVQSETHAFDELVKLVGVIEGSIGSNEATTRMRAIDTLLYDVLGWDKLSVVEERYSTKVGFADYALMKDDRVCMILEAKREGETFVLPKRQFSDKPVSFKLLANECPEAKAAMVQASGYATVLGARYIAITNGHQWILAHSFVPNQPIENRSVYIFESVQAITDRFGTFWRCFNPTAVYDNLPGIDLLETRKAPAPPKLSLKVRGYSDPATRNILVNELSYILDYVWEDVNQNDNDEEFLNKCYVVPNESVDSLALAKELIDNRIRSDEIVVYEHRDTSKITSLVEGYLPEKPVVILGGVGRGKSTFLKYLRLVKAKEEMKKYIQLDIDFNDRPNSRDEVQDYIFDTVEKVLLERYEIDVLDDGITRSALRSELQRFKNSSEAKRYADNVEKFKDEELKVIQSIKSNRYQYMGKIVRDLKKGRNHSIAVFIDNLDRRSSEIQVETLLKASAIARDWSCIVFVCLRPSTFFESTQHGRLDTVAPKTISVVAPRVDVLLKKRFAFARAIAEGDNDNG